MPAVREECAKRLVQIGGSVWHAVAKVPAGRLTGAQAILVTGGTDRHGVE